MIVLDGLGIGTAPDTETFGDGGSDTLGNVASAVGGLELPRLEALGLGCCRPLAGMSCKNATAAHGIAYPVSQGKDSTSGHWELCGLVLEEPFPTYPLGFPHRLIAAFADRTGRGVLGNKAASGTAIIEEFGSDHLERGDWIVYTSADSVFQVAAHEEVVPLSELYDACQAARDEILVGADAVARVRRRETRFSWARPGDDTGRSLVSLGGSNGRRTVAIFPWRPPGRPCSIGWRKRASRVSASARWTTSSPAETSRAATRPRMARRMR